MTAYDPHKLPHTFVPATGEADAAPLEPLPPEFERELQAIDRLLSTSAKMQQELTPIGLSQRLFEASIVRLQSANAETIAAYQHQPVIVGRIGGSMWNRLALAASVALVGGVSLWVLVQRSHTPALPVDGAPALARNEVSLDFDDLNRLAAGIGDFESEVAYLLEATELHSVYDLKDDLDLLASQSEM